MYLPELWQFSKVYDEKLVLKMQVILWSLRGNSMCLHTNIRQYTKK